jgi:hypothetical protein
LGALYFLAALVYWEAAYMQHAHNLGLSASEEENLVLVEKVMVFVISFLDAVVVFWVC